MILALIAGTAASSSARQAAIVAAVGGLLGGRSAVDRAARRVRAVTTALSSGTGELPAVGGDGGRGPHQAALGLVALLSRIIRSS
jgi:hypothetical protein